MKILDAYQAYYWEWSPSLSPASQVRHLHDIKRFASLMGEPSIYELTTRDYQRFRALAVKAKMSFSTIETTLRTIRQTLNATAAAGKLDTVPYKGRGLTVRVKRPQPATLDELAKLWHATIAATWPKRTPWGKPRDFWRGWLGFAYWTGLRLSDLTWRLHRDDIQPGLITFQASKTGVEHVWPMTESLWRILNHWRGDGSHSLFHCARSANLFRKHLRLLCEAAEIRKLTPKRLRQSSVTQWTIADSRAGEIVHGCGMPGVLKHYVDAESILRAAMDRVAWPFPV